MIKGLSYAGLGQVGGLSELIELAAKHQFHAIETSGGQLRDLEKELGFETAMNRLKQRNVSIAAIGLGVDWRNSDEQFKSGLSELAKDAEIAARFGCKACTTYILPSTDEPAAPFMAKAIKRLRLTAQILKEYDIKLALEFVGPHHLRTAWKHPFIWTLEETLSMIDAIGEANVGLLLDSYHWYTTGGTYEQIKSLQACQIVHVHINDAKPVPLHAVHDQDRLYPGEGVIDLVAFLTALKEIGYTGVIAQEVLSMQPPAQGADELASKSERLYQLLYEEAEID